MAPDVFSSQLFALSTKEICKRPTISSILVSPEFIRPTAFPLKLKRAKVVVSSRRLTSGGSTKVNSPAEQFVCVCL